MDNRVLGTIGMICAPALLVGALLTELGNNVITGITSMIFMAGWICINIGMRRMRAAGTGRWGRTVLGIQLFGLVLAFLFGFIEATGLLAEDNIVFLVTDAAWPLSMVWMLVVGVSVIVAKRLSGWRLIVPVLCPFWLPVAMVGGSFGGGGDLVGLGLMAVLWVLLGYTVRESGQQAEAASEPAVQ